MCGHTSCYFCLRTRFVRDDAIIAVASILTVAECLETWRCHDNQRQPWKEKIKRGVSSVDAVPLLV